MEGKGAQEDATPLPAPRPESSYKAVAGGGPPVTAPSPPRRLRFQPPVPVDPKNEASLGPPRPAGRRRHGARAARPPRRHPPLRAHESPRPRPPRRPSRQPPLRPRQPPRPPLQPRPP